MRLNWAGPRVVNQERAAVIIRMAKAYRREKDLTARTLLARNIEALANALATFDESAGPATPPRPPRTVGGYQPDPPPAGVPLPPPRKM